MITRAHDALLEAESSQISAWIDHLTRLETLDPHVLCVVDLRSPLGLSIATAVTDEQHARAQLLVRLERGEIPSFSCAYPVPYDGNSKALRHVLDLHLQRVGEMEGSFVGLALVGEFDSMALGAMTLDKRCADWGQPSWRVVLPGRDPEPPPGRDDTPW